MKIIKALAIILIMILLINITLLALRKINPLAFWIITIVCAIGSYRINKTK
jgi:hypothetical protein